MLVLSRRGDKEIYIGPDITIKVLEIHKRQVKLGIEAPSRDFSFARRTPANRLIVANPVSSRDSKSFFVNVERLDQAAALYC